MYHPVVERYAEEYNTSRTNVLALIRLSLSDPREIMRISWHTMSRIVGIETLIFSHVFHYSWDYSEETESLRKIFQSVLVGGLKKELEDYL